MSLLEYNGISIRNVYEYGPVSHTGNTNLTILESIVIPANTYKAGDLIRIEGMFSKSGTSNGAFVRMYWVAGSTPTTSGATLISTTKIFTSTNFSIQERRLYIRTANGTGTGISLGTECFSSTTTSASDYTSGAISNLSIDWSVTGCIFHTVQLDGTVDTYTQHYLKIWEF